MVECVRCGADCGTLRCGPLRYRREPADGTAGTVICGEYAVCATCGGLSVSPEQFVGEFKAEVAAGKYRFSCP